MTVPGYRYAKQACSYSVLSYKVNKNMTFQIFSTIFLTCRTVFIKISNRNEFCVSNLPTKGQNSLIWLNGKLTSNQANSSGCRLTTGVMQYFSQQFHRSNLYIFYDQITQETNIMAVIVAIHTKTASKLYTKHS